MHRFVAFFVLAGLSACLTPPEGEPTVRHVRLMETARLGSLQVTPVAVAEDSRCPTGVQCIQAGTVRIQARIVDGGGGTRDQTLSLGVPVDAGGGRLSLIRVCPHPVYRARIRPADYLFSLRWSTADDSITPDPLACPPR
ncbi:MAG TPA: hypothetical protein VFO69_08715 [Allosphingosinicella sp.]|nr:hypothetical protein [Allosphingosinicella sp.]